MQKLLRSTTAYRRLVEDERKGELSHAALVLFPDEKYLRPLLRECAKAIYGAKDGSRESALIEEEHFSDCIFLPAEGKKLTVDDGAYIIDESLLRPMEGGKKLFVLDNFHNASPLVQNKLLKVLEEPPTGVYFLLGATADFSVLPTVLSRVKRLEEAPFSEEAVLAALRRMHGFSDGAEEAAAASGGILSSAEELLSGKGEDFALAERLLSLKDTEALCRSLAEKKDKTAFFSALRLVLRDMLFLKTGQEKFVARKGLESLAEEYSAGAIVASLEYLTEAETQIKFNANFGQCVQVLAIRISEEKAKWQKLS